MAFRNSFGKTTVTGRLSSDPELRYLPSGSAVTNFTIPVNAKYTNKEGEAVEETTWYNFSAFGKLAELLVETLKLKKGAILLVEGELIPEIRIWEGRDGNNRASYELKARDVTVIDFGNKPDEKPTSEEEIPF